MDHENNKGTLLKEAPIQEQTEEQSGSQTGQKQIRVYTDVRNLTTSYANGCQTTATAEEILLDFGLNHVQLPGRQGGKPRIVFHADKRIIMNYYTAKRLVITLSQIIRRHEQEYGELELNAKKRRSDPT